MLAIVSKFTRLISSYSIIAADGKWSQYVEVMLDLSKFFRDVLCLCNNTWAGENCTYFEKQMGSKWSAIINDIKIHGSYRQ